MRAVVLRETGAPLSVEDVPEPEVPEGQSLLEVRAAGINFADVLVCQGRYPQPPELPCILGNEVAGEIDGRRVLAFARGSGGGFAERVAVQDEWVFDLPPAASFAEGAAFLTTYLTAWIPMTRQAHVRVGSHVPSAAHASRRLRARPRSASSRWRSARTRRSRTRRSTASPTWTSPSTPSAGRSSPRA
jgi:NADPH:quinone reductase